MIDFKKLLRELDEMNPAQAVQMICTALDASGVSYGVNEGEFIFTSLPRCSFTVEASIDIEISTEKPKRFSFSEITNPLSSNKYYGMDLDNNASRNYVINKEISAA